MWHDAARTCLRAELRAKAVARHRQQMALQQFKCFRAAMASTQVSSQSPLVDCPSVAMCLEDACFLQHQLRRF